jgi:hypothetical protein
MPSRTARAIPEPSLQLVHPELGFGRVKLIEPTGRGYIYIAASVQPGRLPFVLPSRKRSLLIGELKPIIQDLAALTDVVRVAMFRAIVMPPTARFSSYLKANRSLHRANFDVAVLLETTSATTATRLQQADGYRAMIDTMHRRAAYVWTLPAYNAKRIADVDTTSGGLFLFNHFAADDDKTMLELWEYLAAWYVRKTGLRNSVALVPVDRRQSDYAIVNWARWDVHPLRHFWHQLSAPSFWKYVAANLDANRAASMPIYFRRV